MLGLKTSPDAHMTPRERFDFVIVILIFGALAGGANSFAILTAQIMVRYSSFFEVPE
ncbi:hypothetical protein C0989_010204 [Termitomyces sp. Mn162]|nr:hypothetical protein C0989_010204 [Termitomyces sp. Mn162]